jgi:uncharacterized protein (DUF885 family)
VILDRRAWLAGAGAALLRPRVACGEVGTMLDRAASLPPMEAAALLAHAEANTPAERLDVATARAGLTVDAALSRKGAPARHGIKAWVAARAGTRGLAAARDGAALYALLLRRQGGEIAAAAAERRLFAELNAIHRRADRLFVEVGFARGTIGERYAALWRDERHLYSDDDQGRSQAVSDMNAMLGRLRPQIPVLVGSLPQFALNVSIRALTPVEAAAGRGGYRDIPTADHAGKYVVDLKHIRSRPRWTLPSVVAHETLPGHCVQLPIEAANACHPLRLEYASAFVEGWATYAESLVRYPDAFETLGHLHWLLFRTTRALADLGIHRHGWSIDEARSRLIAWQGLPAYFAPWDTELPRIVREPGIRVAEALVWLTIADTAARYRHVDRAAFHRRLLANGRCRSEVIASQGGSWSS